MPYYWWHEGHRHKHDVLDSEKFMESWFNLAIKPITFNPSITVEELDKTYSSGKYAVQFHYINELKKDFEMAEQSNTDELFDQKIEVIKYIRDVADLGLVDAKELAEWFHVACPDRIKKWARIRILHRLAMMRKRGELVIVTEQVDRPIGEFRYTPMFKSTAYVVRKLTTAELERKFNITISVVDSEKITLTEKTPYVFPEYF